MTPREPGKRMKHWVPIALLLVAASLLVGCGDDADTTGEISITCILPSFTDEGCAEVGWEMVNPTGTVQLRTTLDFDTPQWDPERLQIDFNRGNILDLLDDIDNAAIRVQIDERAAVQLEQLFATGAMDDVIRAFPNRCRLIRLPRGIRIPVCT